MFAWGGCRVRMAKEMSGLVALPVGACCGDDIEGGGVRGGAQVGEVGLWSVLERGQGLAGSLAKKEVAEDRAEVAVGTDGDGEDIVGPAPGAARGDSGRRTTDRAVRTPSNHGRSSNPPIPVSSSEFLLHYRPGSIHHMGAGGNLLRRAGYLAAGGGVYGAVTYMTYTYLTTAATDRPCPCGREHSYVHDPQRPETFSRIAGSYDSQISKDEFGTTRRAVGRPAHGRQRGDAGAARAKLKKMGKAERERHTCAVADASKLDGVPDRSVDTVVDAFGLCSFQDPVGTLRAVQKKCRPGGKILLLEHGRSETYPRLNAYLDANAERHAKNWGCVWNRDINHIVERAGLVVETRRNFHFGTTYYLVCRPGPGQDGEMNGETAAEGTGWPLSGRRNES
ncbi:hypothetical protein THAOC_23432 [Thalassiosira oceanica]|uniref:Methyltransferase type 11 domain-containing protein n=1 Tax=Thalassiosira oceanica TaxID=159749 RepID=K0SDE6_THAOC|nr:hypothetical protein THAOC_23432 [Thalassiosira oceanica]|eukprot:EJK56642.1 hypothetical protein THAOC_23432 [Thalassiosira oceanica]